MMTTDMEDTRKHMKKKPNPRRRKRAKIRTKRKGVIMKGRSQRIMMKARTRSHPRVEASLALARLKMTSLKVMNLMIQRNNQKRRKRRRMGKGIRRSVMTVYRYVEDAKIKLILL